MDVFESDDVQILERTMNRPKLAVVSVWVEELDAAERFYRDVIGLEQLHAHAGQPHFKIEDAILVILKGTPIAANSQEHFPILAFSVDNLDFEIDKLSERGIEMPWGVMEREGARWVMFHDPGGNLLEYVEYQ